MAYIGIDVGTSGCKAAVIAQDGTIAAQASRAYPLLAPKPGWAELNPSVVWECVLDILTELAPMSGEVTALAVASLGEAMVFLDEKDQPLGNSITYLDRRCQEQVDFLRKTWEMEPVEQVTGMSLDQSFSLIRYLWIEKEQPWILEKTKRIVLFGDYVSYMLTGEAGIDPASASRTLLFDLRTMGWSDKIGGKYHVRLDWFSPIQPSGTFLGFLRKNVRDRTGLPAALRVYVGSHDQCCAALGLGAVAPGDVMMGMGSSGSINGVLRQKDPKEALWQAGACVEPYLVPGTMLALMAQRTYGTGIKWFAHKFVPELEEECLRQGKDLYEQMDRQCPDTISNVLLLPYLAANTGPEHGRTAGIWGLDLSAGRWEIYRALLEGLCFQTKQYVRLLEKAGLPIRELAATGGCAHSSLLLQMKADILGIPVRVMKNQQAGIRGLGILCGVAQGEFADYSQGARAFLCDAVVYRPDASSRERYLQKYMDYERLEETVKRLAK